MGIPEARILEWVAMPSSRDSSHLGIEPRSPTLWADSLPAELPGKPVFASGKRFICFTVLGFFAEFFLQRRQGLGSCFQWTRPQIIMKSRLPGPTWTPPSPPALCHNPFSCWLCCGQLATFYILDSGPEHMLLLIPGMLLPLTVLGLCFLFLSVQFSYLVVSSSLWPPFSSFRSQLKYVTFAGRFPDPSLIKIYNLLVFYFVMCLPVFVVWNARTLSPLESRFHGGENVATITLPRIWVVLSKRLWNTCMNSNIWVKWSIMLVTYIINHYVPLSSFP